MQHGYTVLHTGMVSLPWGSTGAVRWQDAQDARETVDIDRNRFPPGVFNVFLDNVAAFMMKTFFGG